MVGNATPRHRIIEKPGRQGMGAVHWAEDTSLERAVARSSFPPRKWLIRVTRRSGKFGNYIFGSLPAVSSRQISTSVASAGFSIDEVRLLMN